MATYTPYVHNGIPLSFNGSMMFYKTDVSEGGGSSTLLNGLIAYYKLDETEGTTAYDETANNLDGTVDAAINEIGKLGQCYKFNGTDDEVIMGDASALKPTGAFTMACWYKQYLYGVQ